MSAHTLKSLPPATRVPFRLTAAVFAMAFAPAIEAPSPIWDVAPGTPLRVWIQPSRNVHAVRRAVAEWNSQRLPVRMRLGADSSSADIHVFWTDRFNEPISGRTTAVDDGARHIISATVVLAMSHSDGRVLSDEETRVLALHEMGHAIGLAHSTDPTSVMWPRVRVQTISAADRARVLRLYSVSGSR